MTRPGRRNLESTERRGTGHRLALDIERALKTHCSVMSNSPFHGVFSTKLGLLFGFLFSSYKVRSITAAGEHQDSREHPGSGKGRPTAWRDDD
jgi:hypothetical protein